jgi:hypothetical protein
MMLSHVTLQTAKRVKRGLFKTAIQAPMFTQALVNGGTKPPAELRVIHGRSGSHAIHSVRYYRDTDTGNDDDPPGVAVSLS